MSKLNRNTENQEHASHLPEHGPIDENGKEVTKDIIEAMYEGKDMGIPANIHDIPFFKEQLLQMNMIPCGM